ncbi:hypothetical protein [Legionella clemsonensis]|uniref:Uncharacterized protein n=1 Tax=Legionella clemsonensis TaxID=1867846 RepID=A0A222P2T3_9GAMM|nr:hypothetical protein [Legionella clemsonensis]ASQ46174.1 hypothetical protein clem_08110 [Legionella clemsonensis]
MKRKTIFLGVVIGFFVNSHILLADHSSHRQFSAAKVPAAGANMPPGLQKQGMPKGLIEKTPYGWSKGEKKGWNQPAVPHKSGLGTQKRHKK